jgi:outer membrane protein
MRWMFTKALTLQPDIHKSALDKEVALKQIDIAKGAIILHSI